MNGSFAASASSRLDRYIAYDRVNVRYLAWQLEQFRDVLGQRILEVGCGVGGVIEKLGERELICGIDVEPEVLEYVKRRFPDRRRYQFRDYAFGSLSDVERRELQAMRFDTVVSLNVLEHIEDDVAALSDIRSILQPGGYVAVLVPAHPSLYGEYDRLDGHFRRYSKASLGRAFRASGFGEPRLRYFNAAGAAGWWVSYKLLRRKIHGSGDLSAMDAIIPVARVVERIVPPPFGLSLIARVRA